MRAEYVRFSSQADPDKYMKDIINRSVFQHTSVEQLVGLAEAHLFEPHACVRHTMAQRSLALLGSQLIEDINNIAKNDPTLKAG
eukprot:6273942-Pyramimonas_sp.AAC.1